MVSSYTFTYDGTSENLVATFNRFSEPKNDQDYHLRVRRDENGNPTHMLRTYGPTDIFLGSIKAEEAAELGGLHFGVLADNGIHVPSYEYTIVEPCMQEPIFPWQLYLQADYIDGQAVADDYSLFPEKVTSTLDEIETVIDGLYGYLRWAHTQPSILTDIYHPRQYLYGQNRSIEHDTNHWWMVDIDHSFATEFYDRVAAERVIVRSLAAFHKLYDNVAEQLRT